MGTLRGGELPNSLSRFHKYCSFSKAFSECGGTVLSAEGICPLREFEYREDYMRRKINKFIGFSM
jgi:hypothetical protein